MTLLLENDDVERVLEMRACVDALGNAFREFARGEAVNRPRSHTYTALGEGRHYLFKSMDGSIAREGMHAIRLTSDLVEQRSVNGRRTREKVPAAPGGRYVGLILLFDMEDLAPLAIIQDGYLQRMRVGATSALAARALARGDARTVGMIGSGWQAGAQLLGLQEVGTWEKIRVHSATEKHREAFCAEFTERLGQPVEAVARARDAVDGADLVVLATNAQEPVISGDWLDDGQHVNSIQGHELDRRTLDRADLIAVRSSEQATFHFRAGDEPPEARNRKRLDPELQRKVVELGTVLNGEAGRSGTNDVTLFTGGSTGASSGLGIQFTAVAAAVYRAARAAEVGRELPTEWFTETAKP